MLESADIACLVCEHSTELTGHLKGGVGAIVLTDAIITDRSISQIAEALAHQPAWSDVATVLLSRSEQSDATERLLVSLRNVTILDRPTSRRSLISAIQAALRARRRQYEIREQLTVLRQSEEALRGADRRKDEFLAMLAHELRNPLAPIRTATELLARILPSQDRSRAAADIVMRQVTHLTRLVDDLLDVSRITQGRIQLQLEPVELDSVVTQAIEAVEPLLRGKEHVLNRLSELQPIYVAGDSARLLQCLTNLLTNAAKYTDRGGHIRLAVRGDPDTVTVSVSDDGIGIAPELLPRIFDLFVQSSRSLDRSEGGLGIGLSVVRRLIHMHGGEVHAHSLGLNRGATFEIHLPRIPAPALPLQPTIQAATVRRRILVVDDNVDAADSLAQVLRLDGHDAESVHSARAALSAVATSEPEIVLLDIGLPELDGYQVARRIRAGSRHHIRLIALTGYGQTEDIERTREAGFDAHLVKPVNFEVLSRAIADS